MSSPSRNTMQRKPSHFGSNSQPSPSGMARASLASIGRNGGDRGRAIAAILPHGGNREHPGAVTPGVTYEEDPMTNRWKLAAAAAVGAAMAPVAVITLAGWMGGPAGAAPDP